MATSVLKKITAEAKRIRKRHPSQSWKSAVKEAGRKYRTGKISGVKKKRPARKKSVGVKRKRVAGKKPVRVHNVVHYGTVGTLASHKKAVRTILDDKLSKKLLQIEKAPNKTKRKKLVKQKAVIKKEMAAFR